MRIACWIIKATHTDSLSLSLSLSHTHTHTHTPTHHTHTHTQTHHTHTPHTHTHTHTTHTHTIYQGILLAKCIRFQGSLHRRPSLKHCLPCVDFPENDNWRHLCTEFQQVGQGVHNVQNKVTWGLNWSANVTEELSEKSRSLQKFREESPQWISWKSKNNLSLITGHRQTWSLYRADVRHHRCVSTIVSYDRNIVL